MREYQRRFPNRRAPDRSVFVRIFQQLCLTGSFLPLREGYQLYGTLNQRRRMQRILNNFNNTPEGSVWQASYQLEISLLSGDHYMQITDIRTITHSTRTFTR